MAATMKENAREAIMLAAREAAMARGYGGINFRDLAETVGIKAASINYYFANKALLGEAVARRYWEDISRDFEAISANAAAPMDALRQYPDVFRASLARDNRICLSSFMAAEYDELPDRAKRGPGFCRCQRRVVEQAARRREGRRRGRERGASSSNLRCCCRRADRCQEPFEYRAL
jgi:AcrR family transcriptional regulator